MIFKVDFEKACYSISWDYLDQVMGFLGFGDRWRSWSRGLFKNARTLVLNNGKPTYEFQLFKVLRQGILSRLFHLLFSMEVFM